MSKALTTQQRKAMSKHMRRKARNQQEAVILPDDPEGDGDNRPNEDPITVKGQNYVAFSFMVKKEELEKNRGLVDPFKDIAIKFSGAFKTYAQCVDWNKRLSKAYNEQHKLKQYHQLFNVGMYKWALLPNIDVVVEDDDDPEKVRPLVPLFYEQERLAQFMDSVKTQQEDDMAEQKRRIEETQLLAKEGKTTLAELKASQQADSTAISSSNFIKLVEDEE